MSLRFGTDGVRGVANTQLTAELTLALGRAAARVLAVQSGTDPSAPSRPMLFVGRDTRRSGALLAAALTAGLTAEGIDVVDLGVLPTPGVAYASARAGVPAAMISASHNPFEDNGIKFFSAGGRKLDDDIEARIEAELDRLLGLTADAAGSDHVVPAGALVGEVRHSGMEVAAYEDALVAALDGRRLDGLRIVLDCANGAAADVAPAVFRRLGASVVVLHASPDGININHGCGSTHPDSLQAAVVAEAADMGFAFDGDADRMLAVDHTGSLVDGDQLIAMLALDMRDHGRLAHDTVVVTVMTNLGFKIAMRRVGIDVVETRVGDRYVLEAIEEGGHSLGGEQSGHLIFRDHATTGDGTLSGLLVADLVRRSGRPLDAHGAVMSRLPQILRNVRGVDRSRLERADALWAAVAAEEAMLGETGRVLLRPSGTEALVRVMVEAPTQELADSVCVRLCLAVERELAFPG